MTSRRATRAYAAVLVVAALAGCSPGADSGGDPDTPTVTLLTHDSWAMSEQVVADFERDSGYRLEVVTGGDAGELTNRLVLTAGEPVADVAYGVDNTFASRALDGGVFDELGRAPAPEGFGVPGGEGRLVPVDWSDVCLNVDLTWFDDRGLEPPRTLDDLVDPAYRDLVVAPAASTSSPGFAFLLATVGRYGEARWQDYWRRLVANGLKTTGGWSDAYEVDFSASGGDRPVVLSYASSPPFTIPEGGRRPTTAALLDTCFRQVEYAGVLAGADEPEGAAAVLEWMTSPAFQAALPEQMYVYPVDRGVSLPPAWERWAPPAPDPVRVDPERVARRRSAWLQAWSDITAG